MESAVEKPVLATSSSSSEPSDSSSSSSFSNGTHPSSASSTSVPANETIDIPHLRHQATQAFQQAVDLSFAIQEQDGRWSAPCSSNPTLTAEYIFLKTHYPKLNHPHSKIPDEEAELFRKHFLTTQSPEDGGWGLVPAGQAPSNISCTVEVYLALLILGMPRTHPVLLRAKQCIHNLGGPSKVRFLTAYLLATFGLVPWSTIPQVPAEMMLLPNWAPFNIYKISSWARATLVPLLIIRHHEPIYPLPGRQVDPNSDFLDELWADPSNKFVTFNRPYRDMLWGPSSDWLEMFFSLSDVALQKVTKPLLNNMPSRKLALRKALEWTLDHQEEQGDWGGIFPPMHNCLWALLIEGYPSDHERVQKSLESFERFAVIDEKGKWIQPTVSPCWDTGLMIKALCEAGMGIGGHRSGVGDNDARIAAAVTWIRKLQLWVPYGDWRVYSKSQSAGGWPFQEFNSHYPDVDDTAVVLMALVRHDPAAIEDPANEAAVVWILGMQNRDGGWGAFDTNNDADWLHKIPFSDMDNLCDPSTADVTGRILECFGLLLNHRKQGRRLNPDLSKRVREACHRALEWLITDQRPSGAFVGRWGINYNYGTSIALRGLPQWCSDRRVAQMGLRAVLWYEQTQNEDGGWGETIASYDDEKRFAGKGSSTAANTAWALEALMRFRPSHHPAILRGIRWLVENQHPKGELELRDYSSWPSHIFVGTGFPKVFYLGYPFYHHYFCISALGRFLDSTENIGSNSLGLTVGGSLSASGVFPNLQQQDVLLVALGDGPDFDLFLGVAQGLVQKGRRVRIATSLVHRNAVETNGCEFYDIGEPSDASVELRMVRLWQAAYDEGRAISAIDYYNEAKTLRTGDHRPFAADIIVSTPKDLTHLHAAETMQAPLVLVSAESTNLPSSGRWNSLAFFFLQLLQWLKIGKFLNNLRVNKYHLSSLCWVWATRDARRNGVPLVSKSKGNVVDVAVDVIENELGKARINSVECSLIPTLTARWKHPESGLSLSGVAAASLVSSGTLGWEDLEARPGVDWASRRLGQTSKSRLHVFCKLASGVAVLIGVLLSVLGWIFGLLWSSQQQVPGIKEGKLTYDVDVVKVARVKKSMYDLGYLRQKIDQEKAAELDRQLSDSWSYAVAEEHQNRFSGDFITNGRLVDDRVWT